jgi:hypothetical protein
MDIPHFKYENLGSLRKIQFLPIYAFQSFTPGFTGIVAADVVLRANFAWSDIYFTVDTAGHQQDENLDDHGEFWTQQVVAFVPADELELEQTLLQFRNVKYVLLITLQNGLQKIVGTPDQALDIKIKSSTQDTIPGRNGHALTFSGNTTKRALLLL